MGNTFDDILASIEGALRGVREERQASAEAVAMPASRQGGLILILIIGAALYFALD